jgi:ammonium transporter Rh
VAMGASARLQTSPGGALLVGILAGLVSVMGFVHVTPFLESKLTLFDTCGVHNLHGMPSILGGLASAVFVAIDSQAEFLVHSDKAQPGQQVLAVVATLGVAVVSGFLTGRILVCVQDPTSSSVIEYDDAPWWEGEYFSALVKEDQEKMGRSHHSVGIMPVDDTIHIRADVSRHSAISMSRHSAISLDASLKV